MTEVERIKDQLRRAFTGEAWHGPSVMELLANVSAAEAASYPVKGAHSIWELALHIGAWVNAGRRRLHGDRAELDDNEDWPAVPAANEEAWRDCQTALEQDHQALMVELNTIDEDRLDQPILDGMPSVYITMHGVIQHCLYHGGQIAILKKALEK